MGVPAASRHSDAEFRLDVWQLTLTNASVDRRRAGHRITRRKCVLRCLVCSLDFHDRPVLASGMEGDIRCQFRTGTATHQCPWLGTGRATRPTYTRLNTWLAVGGERAVVDLVGLAFGGQQLCHSLGCLV